MSRSLKVAMVDNNQLLMDSLQGALRKEDGAELVATFRNPAEMINYLGKNKVDVVVTELDLEESDGVAVIQRIHRLFGEVRTVLLTMNEDASLILKAVDYHVDGIQMKDCRLEELVQAFKIVASGQKYYAPQVLKLIASRAPKESQADLSRREVEIMQMLAGGHSAKEIGDKLLISARTVETHKANIMRKLNVKKATQLVKIAYDRGLVKANA